jgi:hypothetical protein
MRSAPMHREDAPLTPPRVAWFDGRPDSLPPQVQVFARQPGEPLRFNPDGDLVHSTPFCPSQSGTAAIGSSRADSRPPVGPAAHSR